jgi:hypothetical protein
LDWVFWIFILDFSLVLFLHDFVLFLFYLLFTYSYHYPGTYPATLLGRRGNLLSSSSSRLHVECLVFCFCWTMKPFHQNC